MYIRKLSFEGLKKHKQVSRVYFHVTVIFHFAPSLKQNPLLCASYSAPLPPMKFKKKNSQTQPRIRLSLSLSSFYQRINFSRVTPVLVRNAESNENWGGGQKAGTAGHVCANTSYI
jgi:hypothetical protein